MDRNQKLNHYLLYDDKYHLYVIYYKLNQNTKLYITSPINK